MLEVSTKCSKKHPLAITPLSIAEHPWHIHKNEIELIYILKGELEVHTSLYTFHLKEGDTFLFNSTVMHCIRGKKDNIVLMYHFNIPYFSNYFPDLNRTIFICDPQSKEKQIYFQKLNKYLEDLFLECYYSLDSNASTMIDTCIAAITLLKNYFSGWQINNRELVGLSPFHNNPIRLERLLQTISYLYNNYDKKISLNDIASEGYVSKYYISHIMTEGLGISFQTTLKLIRTEIAQKYLYSTNMPISEISEKCGFSSPSFFRKTYTHYMGISPSEDRSRTIGHTAKDMDFLHTAFDEDRSSLDSICNLLERIPEKPLSNITLSNEFNIASVDIDIIKDKEVQTHPPKIRLLISDMNELFYEAAISTIKELIANKTCRLIAVEQKVFEDLYNTFKSWEPLSGFVKLIKENSLYLVLIKTKNFLYNSKTLNSLSAYLEKAELDESKWWFDEKSDIKSTCKNDVTIPNIISELIAEEETIKYVSLFSDESSDISPIHLNLFYRNGLRTPAYYSYYIMNRLGNKILKAEKKLLITKKNDTIQILLSNIGDDMVNNYIFKIKNLKRNYICSIFYCSHSSGDENKIAQELLKNGELDEQIKKLIELKSFPQNDFYSIDATAEYTLYISSPKDAVVFIELR